MKAILIYAILMILPGSVLMSSSKKTEQFNLKVTKGGETLGVISTSEITCNNRVAYFLYSSVEVNLLLKVQITESISDVFESDLLSQSVQSRYINGKLKTNNTLKKIPSGYELNNEDQKRKLLDEEIKGSILSLYYHEPKHGDRVYSQNLRTMLEVEKTGPSKYSVKLPKGYATTYTYHNGLLQTVESETAWGNILFERVAENE